jgi:tryptophan-rich sensory protein
VLWHEREKKGHLAIRLPVIGAFILAVLLHSLWNISASTGRLFPAGSVIAITGSFVIAIISLTLVIWRFRKARNTFSTTGTG